MMRRRSPLLKREKKASIDVNSIIERLSGRYGSTRPRLPVELDIDEIRILCLEAREILMHEPILLELRAPLKVCGDVHGQFHDLLRLFGIGGWPPESGYLFLGDYVDRGKYGIETMCLLLALKIRHPQRVYLLRGNHESASITRIYGFFDECRRRYNVKVWRTFCDLFNCLPIAAVVSGRIFCTHGGLSPELGTLEPIRKIPRPANIPDRGLLCDLLWSDPDPHVKGWGRNDRGVSFTFGADALESFLTRNDLDLVARAHQVVEAGYEFFASRRLVTIFSAPNYCGEFNNAGALMSIDANLVCSFQIIKPLELGDMDHAMSLLQIAYSGASSEPVTGATPEPE